MTITVDLRPEIQVELARQAAAHGSAVEAYAASLLEEAVNPAAGTNRLPFDKQRGSGPVAVRSGQRDRAGSSTRSVSESN